MSRTRVAISSNTEECLNRRYSKSFVVLASQNSIRVIVVPQKPLVAPRIYFTKLVLCCNSSLINRDIENDPAVKKKIATANKSGNSSGMHPSCHNAHCSWQRRNFIQAEFIFRRIELLSNYNTARCIRLVVIFFTTRFAFISARAFSFSVINCFFKLKVTFVFTTIFYNSVRNRHNRVLNDKQGTGEILFPLAKQTLFVIIIGKRFCELYAPYKALSYFIYEIIRCDSNSVVFAA